MASLLYGTGMRLMNVVPLRVQDLDFDYRQIVVRNAKGANERRVPLPEALHAACASTWPVYLWIRASRTCA